MRGLYLVLAITGFILPYYFFIEFLAANGLSLSLLIQQLFGTPGSTFFAVDLLITAIGFWVFLYREARRLQMNHWWVYIAATLVVGPSFAFPLFLYFREPCLDAQRSLRVN
jgi:hypothetical protein